jgi:hypothetical protein
MSAGQSCSGCGQDNGQGSQADTDCLQGWIGLFPGRFLDLNASQFCGGNAGEAKGKHGLSPLGVRFCSNRIKKCLIRLKK